MNAQNTLLKVDTLGPVHSKYNPTLGGMTISYLYLSVKDRNLLSRAHDYESYKKINQDLNAKYHNIYKAHIPMDKNGNPYNPFDNLKLYINSTNYDFLFPIPFYKIESEKFSSLKINELKPSPDSYSLNRDSLDVIFYNRKELPIKTMKVKSGEIDQRLLRWAAKSKYVTVIVSNNFEDFLKMNFFFE